MPLIIKTATATILYVQPEMKFRSPPGHFHHEPPLNKVINFQKFSIYTSKQIDEDIKFK